MLTTNVSESSTEALTLGVLASDLRFAPSARLSSEKMMASAWIPREVGCRHCPEIACMDLYEQVSDDEIAVHYVCPDCGWRLIRNFHESELDESPH